MLLLEAGGKDDWFWIDIPVGYLYTIGNPRTDWCFKTEPDAGLNGRSLGYARGKVLGGCSSINAMVYMRGQKGDYDHWASLGNRDWSWDDVLPYFKRAEQHFGGANEHHGCDGELRVEEPRVTLGDPRRVARGGRGMRHPEGRGIQPRRQLRQRVLPHEPAPRRALERDQGVPAAGARAPEPHGRHEGARAQASRSRRRTASSARPASSSSSRDAARARRTRGRQ